MWTQNEAIELLKKLEPNLAAVGFHCALAGSVLYRGTSEKDLDVIIYPHTYKKGNASTSSPALDTVLKLFFGVEKIKACGSESSHQERDDKEVKWLTTEGNKRVDLFFLK